MDVAIEKAYLLITTSCNDRCRYCIVRQRGEQMDRATIRDAVGLVFATAGDAKKVAIYGGEPLVRWDLVRATVAEVRRAEDATGKSAGIYIYTNGYALDGRRLAWLDRHGVSLIISLDVCQELRPPARRSPAHRARFPVKVAAVRRALDVLGPERVCGASVLLPREVDRLPEQLRYLYDEVGLAVVKVLPGLGRYHWGPAALDALRDQLAALLPYLLASAAGDRPRYFDLLNEALHRAGTPGTPGVRDVSVVEIYPNRRFGMSPCEFELPPGTANVNDTALYYLGSLDRVDLPQMAEAVARLDRAPRHAGLRLLSSWTEAAARKLVERAARAPALERYLAAARRLAFA